MIRALVFDFDGLILDTEVPDYESWREMYQEHGCELALEEWLQCVGTGQPLFDPYEDLERQLGGPIDREIIGERRRERYREQVAAQEILPGVLDYLESARRMGLAVAVASSSDRKWVGGHLTRLELMEFFGCIRCKDDVAQTKPHPELYLAAVQALEVEPHEAIAFEDSLHGLVAAKAAGLYCVAVPNAVTRSLGLEQADLVLTSLSEMPLEQLLARFSTAIPGGYQRISPRTKRVDIE